MFKVISVNVMKSKLHYVRPLLMDVGEQVLYLKFNEYNEIVKKKRIIAIYLYSKRCSAS